MGHVTREMHLPLLIYIFTVDVMKRRTLKVASFLLWSFVSETIPQEPQANFKLAAEPRLVLNS